MLFCWSQRGINHAVVRQIEAKVNKNLPQGLSRSEGRIRGALSDWDEFFLNSEIRVQSETAPEASRKRVRQNQDYNEDYCKKDSHPELCTSVYRSPHSMNLDHDRLHDSFAPDKQKLIS